MRADIGIIGGSGFYKLPGFEAREVSVQTPFGVPSSPVVLGELNGVPVAFIARHGPGHVYPPDEVPYRANIYALKQLGARVVLGVNAVGSLQEEVAPGHLVVPDDLFDRTHGRAASFFGTGLVAHVSLGHPLCAAVRGALVAAAPEVDTPVHDGGTLVVTQGPRFSTLAESEHYRSSGFRIIGMTSLPEAALAREAEMCYATVAIVTDYDVWHETEAEVSVDMVLGTMRLAVAHAQGLVSAALPALAAAPPCSCQSALANAITTAPSAIDEDLAAKLDLLVGRYLDS
ncbi:MAG: S-methyl-5'-thioadenosine phosphorylase [Anaerolineae bacterium]